MIQVVAPSNIALVKYMGKRELTGASHDSGNTPENSSISMTLDSLCTKLSLERVEHEGVARGSGASVLHSLSMVGPYATSVSEKMQSKFVSHILRTRAQFPEIAGAFGLRLRSEREVAESACKIVTENTFPMGAGIASSASSFAALTLAVAMDQCKDPRDFSALWKTSGKFRERVARVSRQGSGSSCRSLSGPFVYWSGTGEVNEVLEVSSKLPELSHAVIVVSDAEKKVSSTDAHQLVKSSPLWRGRSERAELLCSKVKTAIEIGDLASVGKEIFVEAMDMHSLFHTAATPFSFWNAETMALLQAILAHRLYERVWITMDAGPNVHVIGTQSELHVVLEALEKAFGSPLRLLRDQQGKGARFEV